MGANCCSCNTKSVKDDSVITLADLQGQATDLREMETEETREDAGPLEQGHPSPDLRTSEVLEKFSSVSMGLQEEISSVRESPRNLGQDGLSSCYIASNILWSTGSFSDPIPDGFYSVIPDNNLKLSESIPTLSELRMLAEEGIKADVILIDFERDTKLFRLKSLINKLAGGLNPNPAKVIKKIAGVVVDVHKLKTPQSGIQLLGDIKHGSCHSRAILFKVLADTVGLESSLVLGFSTNLKSSASVDAYNHMSVVVVLNTVEMLVDLMRSPGQLIPMSTKAIYMAHSSGNGPCHSPLEPNSPMYRIDHESLSRSEPNIATEFLQRSQGKVISEQRTANSSCKSDGAGQLETKRMRRSLSATPENSDDIARAMRVMSKSVKQSRFSKERSERTGSPSLQKNVSEQMSGGRSTLDPQTAISLPSSPQNNQSESLHQNISDIWNEVLRSPMFQNKPLLPYEEWNIDYSELKVGSPVGRGCFGKVYRGIWNGTDVAIKVFLEQDLTVENIKDFCNEISILCRLRHPNVILFLGACTKPPKLSLVTEFMENGSLYHALYSTKQMKSLSWKRKLKMLRDICRGLMCIHRMGIVHRDLKSANCLLSDKWKIKICDFGLSRVMKATTAKDNEAAGTPEWMAPELIRNEPFSEKCDIFSFGVIMWEFCTLSKPWEGVPIEKVIYTVANEGARLEIPEGPLSKLIAACWSEPEQRPSCEQILARLATCEYSLS